MYFSEIVFRQRSFIVLLIFLSFFLYSCGKKQETEKINITVSFWGTPKEIEIINDIVSKWEEEHPDVEVLLDHTPYSGYISKVLTRIAGGTEPDVIACEVNLFPSLWGKDVFLNLSPYIREDSTFNKNSFFPEVIKRFTIDSKIYGIPRDTAPFACVFYNKKLFDEAGVEYPSDTWVWYDLLEKAKKLTVRTEKGEITQYGFYTWAWQNFVYCNGGRMVDNVNDPEEFTLDNFEAVEGLDFYVDLILEHEVSPSPMSLVNLGMGADMMFKTGRLAMLGSGIWETPSLREIRSFGWDVAMFPKGPDGARAFGTGGTAYCVMQSTEYPGVCWDVVKALTSEEAQVKLAESGLAQPARIEVAEGPHWAGSESPPQNKSMLNEAVKYVVYEPFHPRWREIKDLYIEEKLDLVYMGKLTVEEAMKEVDSAVNKILKSEN